MGDFKLKAFGAVQERDVNCFGWKAVCQALLYERGFQVPEGFLLYMEDIHHDAMAVYEAARKMFPNIMSGFSIMRSSAMNEDGVRSFAGVYDSVVFEGSSFEKFREALETVAASYERVVLDYAEHGNVPKRFTALVQHVLDPDCSGVAYTLDPVLGLEHVIIESTYGLNMLLTDGKISPDYIQLNQHGEVIAKRFGRKQRLVKLTECGLTEYASNQEQAKAFSISDNQITVLYDSAIRLKDIFGKHQDIEWAFERDKLYILQSRDITV